MTGEESEAVHAKFRAWVNEVNDLSQKHLKCTWLDLCGDIKPLRDGYNDQLTPYEFVHNWCAKYDLDWYEED